MKMAKKFFSLLLCAVMVLGLVPFTTQEAHAAGKTPSVIINGKKLGDNERVTCGNGWAEFDEQTSILTLHEAEIVFQRPSAESYTSNALYIGGKVTVKLEGKNTITANYDKGNVMQAMTTDKVTIVGGDEAGSEKKADTLTINVSEKVLGLYVFDNGMTTNTTIKNCGVSVVSTASADYPAVEVYDGKLILDNATLTVESGSGAALWVEEDIEITNGSSVSGLSGDPLYNAICAEGAITINNSTVQADTTNSQSYPAIYAENGMTVTNNSAVRANQKDGSQGKRGITTNGDMTVKGGSTVEATGTTDEGMVVRGSLNVENSEIKATSKANLPGIFTYGNMQISGASDVTASGGAKVGYNPNNNTWSGTATFTPPEGSLYEIKVGNTSDGSDAKHFTASPYSEAYVINDENELNTLAGYSYFHYGKHTHTGGTATCTGKAVCTECDKKYGEADINNHDWKVVAYNWSEDGKSCTAERVCKRDGSHKETAKATNITNEVTKEATCTEKGKTTYTADFTEDWADKQTKDIEDIPATGHNFADGKCTVCGAVAPGFECVITAGADSTWRKGSEAGLSFTSNAAFAHFRKVQVDGQDIDKANYEVKAGSTVVTLKATYLESLPAGKHTVSIVSDTGTAEASFTVAEKTGGNTGTDGGNNNQNGSGNGQGGNKTDTNGGTTGGQNQGNANNPKTGDDSHMALWIALMVVSLAGVGSTVWYSRKKKAVK